MTDETLLPCPFCGGKASVEPQMHNSVRPDDFVAACTNESCDVVIYAEGASEGLAIKSWNTRNNDHIAARVEKAMRKSGFVDERILKAILDND